MRRVIAPALLAACCGCYLLSDEPKARKQPKAQTTAAEGQPAEDKPAEGESERPSPSASVGDCPEFLTGVEERARTIAGSCGSVRVRGNYRVDGGSLTLEAGVELRFEPDAVLEVGRDRPGLLSVRGTAEQPVRMVADSVSDSGRWQGLRLHARADGSSITSLELSGAGTEDEAALWIVAVEVAVEGLSVRSSGGLALELAGEQGPQLLGVELAGTGVVARATPGAVAGLHEPKLDPGAMVAIAPGTVSTTLEWPPSVYAIEGLIRVEGDAERPAQLSLSPGTELRFGPAGRIAVGGLGPGALSASTGAVDDPVGSGFDSLPAPDGVPSPSPSPPSPPVADPATLADGDAIRLVASTEEGGATDPRAGAWSGLLVEDRGQLLLRGVELAHGGARDEGVIVADGSASIDLEGCLLHDNLVGVELRGVDVRVEGFDQNEFRATPVAIRTSPTLLGALGPGNRFEPDAAIHVSRGKVEADATWAATGAPIVVHGDVFVDKGATLSVAPGARLSFDPGVILGVGYYETARVEMRGTADAPIVLEAARTIADVAEPGPQPWGGVVLGAHAQKSRFEHVQLRATANDAAIELRDGADATLVNVDCAGCAGAVVTWDCESTIGNIAVTASEGTPRILAAPENCR